MFCITFNDLKHVNLIMQRKVIVAKDRFIHHHNDTFNNYTVTLPNVSKFRKAKAKSHSKYSY